jgi:hypothetical protein
MVIQAFAALYHGLKAPPASQCPPAAHRRWQEGARLLQLVKKARPGTLRSTARPCSSTRLRVYQPDLVSFPSHTDATDVVLTER